jgi:Zn-dependent protease
MLPTILSESAVSVAEVEAELREMAAPKKRAARNLLFLLSLMAFVLIGTGNSGPSGIVILVVVLLLHELGHLAAMKLFGYRDTQMLFIPLLGAAVSGVETHPSGTRRALVSLSGPAPGIALGILTAILFHATGVEVFRDAARAFLILNTLNLLPFIPLDGGRFVEAVLFSRHPVLRTLFTLAGGVVLALAAFAAKDFMVSLLAFAVLASVRFTYFSTRLAAEIKRDVPAESAAAAGSDEAPLREEIPSRYLERLIPLLEQRLPEKQCNVAGIAAAVRSVWNMVWFKPPSMIASAGLLAVYLGCLGTGVLATLGAEASFRSQELELASTRWLEGGLYAVKVEDGAYQILKILKVDERGVHIRIYSNRFGAVPGAVEEASLFLAGVKGGSGEDVGVGHTALSRETFAAWGVQYVQLSTVSASDLEGYWEWLAAKGGYF